MTHSKTRMYYFFPKYLLRKNLRKKETVDISTGESFYKACYRLTVGYITN